MDFNFGNNDEPANPEENNDMFSFIPDNNGADADNSVADDAAAFDWTPDESANSEEVEQTPDFIIDEANADEEAAPDITDVSDDAVEEFASDIEDCIDNNVSDASFDEQTPEDMFDDSSEEAAASEPNAFEEPSEEDAQEDAQEGEQEDAQMDGFEEPQFDQEAPLPPLEEPAPPLPAALNKKVRTPDGDKEYLLSELIDVETGAALDLTSLIPEELLSSVAPAVTNATGFSFGGSESTAEGFDMSAEGESSPASSKKKRPARPKAEKKKGGGILGIVMGGLLAVILFPYVMALIEITTGAQSNIPIPAPGIPSTYKYIPEWWPDWAMFVFPGRTVATDDQADKSTNNPADKPADKPADNSAPKDAADESAPEDEALVPADAADQADQPDQLNDAAAEDGDFDPEAFLRNEGENNAQPADDDASADKEPVKPGVVNAPVYTSTDVSDAVVNVSTAFKAAKATIDDAVYAALNDMAEKSTFVDTKNVDATLKESMDKVKRAMEKFGAKDELAAALADKWEARAEAESDNAGVMLVGTLKSVSERDGYQINLVEIQGKDGLTVEVVGLRPIKPVVGDKVVVCGKRIADPSNDLGGFNANLQPVVWGGIVLKSESK